VAREISQLLGRVFAQRHPDGHLDLEAVEMALRSARLSSAAMIAARSKLAPR
jgi:hypothetical protein